MPTTLHRIDGIKLSTGKQAYGSKEMALWWATFVRFMRVKHGITIITIKVADLAPTASSAGTHLRGYAVDHRTWSLTRKQQEIVIHEATRFGMPDCLRTNAQGFSPHGHGPLDVGYVTPCSYQVAAIKRGRDGLARNNVDPDRHLRPKLPWPTWDGGLRLMLAELEPKPQVDAVKVTPIPRHITPKPWMEIREDGVTSGLFWSRVQWQLQIKPTGVLDHFTVRALKVWLGGPSEDDGTGVLRVIDVLRLQFRIGVKQDAQWGPVTTLAFQQYLNTYRHL